MRPSTKGLDFDFVSDLLRYLSPGTRGLLLAGGEPTLATTFCDTLHLAAELGFLNVAVISNGAHLANEKIADHLTSYATSLRISLSNVTPESYGKSFGCDPSEFWKVLKSIRKLRSKIDRENSPLQIGIASLTAPENHDDLVQLVDHAKDAGAHWLYFHPFIDGWTTGSPVRTNQEVALASIKNLVHSSSTDFPVMFFDKRYASDDVYFEGYHSAFFLLMVGADKRIYLGAETKYQPAYEVYDLSNWQGAEFLAAPELRQKVLSFSSSRYAPIYSRGRGVLYNDLIEKVINNAVSIDYLRSMAVDLDPRHLHIL